MFTDKESFKQAYLMKLIEKEGIRLDEATNWDRFCALVVLLKEKMSYSWVINKNSVSQGKQVYYFSMEFLIGKLLHNYLVKFQVEDLVREGLSELKV